MDQREMSTDTRKRNAKIRRFIKQIPMLRTAVSSVFRLFKAFLILKYYINSHYFRSMTEPEKREHIFKISRIFGTRIFVETGTYLGLTTEFLAPHFEKCFTIEIDKDLYTEAKDRLKDFNADSSPATRKPQRASANSISRASLSKSTMTSSCRP